MFYKGYPGHVENRAGGDTDPFFCHFLPLSLTLFIANVTLSEDLKVENLKTCKVIFPTNHFTGKQGLSYQVGISSETVGSTHLHMQLATIPAKSQAKAHKHEHHETSVYALSGSTWVRFGEKLENELEVPEGSFLYIPEGVPHLPFNKSEHTAVVVIARTDPNEQESVIMLPALDYDLISETK